MRDFLTEVALAGAAVLFAAWLLLVSRGRIARAADALAKVSLARLAVFLAFVAVAAIHGGAKNGATNEPPRGASNGRVERFDGRVERVEGSDESTRSTCSTWLNTSTPFSRLESETTNETYSYAMPVNATRYENWWRHGAYENVFQLDLDGMLFPLGEYLCDYLWVYTWGMVGARLADASNRVVATGIPMMAVPGVSRFWSAEAADGGKILTWENFFLNRDTNTPVSAQLELKLSGDYIARSNLVERLYRRVNPDDWDDDGIPNDDDFDPYFYDGDNFGPHQELPQGANSNAYCWVDLVVPDANSLVTFAGDGPSALPDPTFIAKAGETNRVTLLIGKTYQVTSRMPISCIDQSSGDIEVYQISPTELQIVWPVEIEASSMRSGSSFSMSVWPDWLGGGFTWTNSCCQVASLGGWQYSISCGNNCLCSGCGAEGYYGYEAYRLPAYGGSCGCSSHGGIDGGGDDGDPPSVGVSVSFSRDAVIFESAYTNSYGQHVNGQSTSVRLTCRVCGGVNGGRVSLALSGGEKLMWTSGDLLPIVGAYVHPNQVRVFNAEYYGVAPSEERGDIVASASFIEDNVSGFHDDVATLTAIRVMTFVDVPWIPWTQRKELGVGETVLFSFEPSEDNFEVAISGCTYTGDRWEYTTPARAATQTVTVSSMGCELPLVFQTLEPTGLVAEIEEGDWFGTVGVAGGFSGTFDVFVIPTNVSFQALQTREVGCISTDPSGVFTNSAYAGWLDHSLYGAGGWHGLNPMNKFYDTVTLPAIQDWMDGGSFTWPIPNEWRISTNGVPVAIPHDLGFDQRFEIDTDGTSRIKKFHWILERYTNSEHSVRRAGN